MGHRCWHETFVVWSPGIPRVNLHLEDRMKLEWGYDWDMCVCVGGGE